MTYSATTTPTVSMTKRTKSVVRLPLTGMLWYTRSSTNVLSDKVSKYTGKLVRHLDEVVLPNTPVFVLEVQRINPKAVGFQEYEYKVLLPGGNLGFIVETFYSTKVGVRVPKKLSKLVKKPLL